MCILLFRYLKRKYGDRKARKNGTAPPSEAAGSGRRSTTRAELLWNVALMVALIIPVFLETLDYTGKNICAQSELELIVVGTLLLVVATAQVHIAVGYIVCTLFLFILITIFQSIFNRLDLQRCVTPHHSHHAAHRFPIAT